MTVLVTFISYLANILVLAIIARVILSWFSVNPGNPFMTILFHITEPILGPLRRVIPRVGIFDFTPIIAIVLIRVIANLILRLATG